MHIQHLVDWAEIEAHVDLAVGSTSSGEKRRDVDQIGASVVIRQVQVTSLGRLGVFVYFLGLLMFPSSERNAST